jgi:SAM-dependent methyltransferase
MKDFSELAAVSGAHAEARAIQVAVKLRLFEALAAGSLDDGELAAALRCDRRAVRILAGAMTALGLLEFDADRYRLAPVARRHLLESSDEYLGGMILFDEAIFPYWSRLEESIQSGNPARVPDMFQNRPEETARFIRAMDGLTRARGDARWLAEHLDLSGVRTIADVGGGPGTYLAAVIRRHRAIRPILCDLPATLEVARTILRERDPDALGRIEFVSLDYNRDELPAGCDAILLANIIHSEDEAANRALIAKCFRALNAGGRLIVKDHVMNRELTAPRAGAIFSLYLLMMTRGRDYSFDEISEWMRTAGFAQIAEQTLPSPPFSSSLVIARKS